MVADKVVANAVGAKTARACDGCIRKRARWYCAADDAFLCQACDASVHSANPLARRHERVRLKTASNNKSLFDEPSQVETPSWHRGFTRKARTPRHGKSGLTNPHHHHHHHHHQTSQLSSEEEEPVRNLFPLVPEISFDETSPYENEEQLLYRVPIFDPFLAELCTSTTTTTSPNEAASAAAGGEATAVANEYDVTGMSESKAVIAGYGGHNEDNLHGFLPTEMDLADFAADVESLLGRGLENECFGMEGLGLSDCTKENDLSAAECSSLSSRRVKLEDQEEEGAMAAAPAAAYNFDMEIDMTREPFELNFDYDSPITGEEEEEEVKVVVGGGAMVVKRNGGGYEEEEDDERMMKKKKRKEVLLRLDYEAVITAWSSQGSSLPWTDGTRPDLDDCWSDFMGTCGTEVQYPYEDMSGMVGSGHSTMADGGREARVSRYREKRRTRLFSKKIRYEVRKLNAEKRPRMKGRFVKRTSFAAPGFPLLGK